MGAGQGGIVGGGVQGAPQLAHVVAGKAARRHPAPGPDHLLVQSPPVGSGEHQAGVGHHHQLVNLGHPSGDPTQASPAGRRPDLGAK